MNAHIEEIIGSFVIGEVKRGSDLDILVEFRGKKTFSILQDLR